MGPYKQCRPIFSFRVELKLSGPASGLYFTKPTYFQYWKPIVSKGEKQMWRNWQTR